MVSVNMAIWNSNQQYVQQAIASLRSQSFEDWELVIVEDPSPNLATQTIQAFNDDRIKYFLNEERTSLVQQRNQAIEESKGEFIAILDSDDLCEPDRLKEQHEFLIGNSNCAVVGCQLEIIDSDGKKTGVRNYPCTNKAILAMMPFRNPIAQPGVMFRRSAVVELGGYADNGYTGTEDYELWSRLFKHGAVICNHSKRLVKYRIHGLQTKSVKLREQILGTIAIKRTYWSKQLGAIGWLRIVGEYFLLLLPVSWVIQLFHWLYLKDRSH